MDVCILVAVPDHDYRSCCAVWYLLRGDNDAQRLMERRKHYCRTVASEAGEVLDYEEESCFACWRKVACRRYLCWRRGLLLILGGWCAGLGLHFRLYLMIGQNAGTFDPSSCSSCCHRISWILWRRCHIQSWIAFYGCRKMQLGPSTRPLC